MKNSWERYMLRVCDHVTEIEHTEGNNYKAKYKGEPCTIKFEFRPSYIFDTRIFIIYDLNGKELNRFHDMI